MRSVVIFMVGFLLVWQDPAAARSEWSQNTHILPPYCKERAKSGGKFAPPRRYSALKNVWIHVHHYCAGVYAETKARSAVNQRERKKWLGKIISQMSYVSRNCKTDCVLYPELHSRWGWALAEGGQAGDAVKHYKLAIAAKPRYTPAYARLSDLYVELNQRGEARRVIEQGLNARPKSKLLKRRLEELQQTSEPLP